MQLRYPQKAADILTALYKLLTMVCVLVVTAVLDTPSSEAKNPQSNSSG